MGLRRWRPSQLTIRSRITALATFAVGLLLALGAVALVAAQRQQLQAALDNGLVLRAEELEGSITARRPEQGDLVIRGNEDRVSQLVAADGRVLVASDGLENAAPIAPWPEGSGDVLRTIGGLPVEDDAYRILSRRIDTPAGEVAVHVGENTDDMNDSVGILATTLLATVPPVVVLLGLLVWWLVGRTLRPVEAIRAEVADIGGAALHRRVPRPDTNDEIARLAATMNAMLDRLEASAARQHRFVADASHELRNPLTRIRSEVEVALSRSRDGTPGSDQTLRSVLEETMALQRLVSDLLHLARNDAGLGADPQLLEPVDLDDIVFREVRRVRAEGHVVDSTGISAAQLIGDANQLTRVVRNLLDNSVRHAVRQSTVLLGEHHNHVVLRVSNDGSPIPEADRERIFERFARLDDARTADTGGTGLGLAIARDLVELHGGTIAVVSDADDHDGAVFEVRLPVAP